MSTLHFQMFGRINNNAYRRIEDNEKEVNNFDFRNSPAYKFLDEKFKDIPFREQAWIKLANHIAKKEKIQLPISFNLGNQSTKDIIFWFHQHWNQILTHIFNSHVSLTLRSLYGTKRTINLFE